MRVNETRYAKRIEATLRDWDVVCDKEECLDNIIYLFSRLHGIGVAVKMTGDRNNYEFMLYPDGTDTSYSKYESVYAFKSERMAMCRSAALCLDTVHIPDITREMVEKALNYVEKELCLPHWEDYLAEYNKLYYTSDPAIRRPYAKVRVVPPSRGNIIDDLVDAFKQRHPEAVKAAYCEADLKSTENAYKQMLRMELNSVYGYRGLSAWDKMDIQEVIFNDPATIVIWKDGSKTVVKAQDGETFDPEKGLAMAICKKVMGNTRDYYLTFKKYLKQWEKEHPVTNASVDFEVTTIEGSCISKIYQNTNGEIMVEKSLGAFCADHNLWLRKNPLKQGFDVYRESDDTEMFIESEPVCEMYYEFIKIIEKVRDYFNL